MIKLFALYFVLAVVSADHINKNAEIKNYLSEVNADGTYQYGFDTSNGIYVQESGIGGVGSRGSVAYYSPDGTPIQLTWTADEYGFHPQGNHLPTPPPVPDYVLRMLEQIRLNPPKTQ